MITLEELFNRKLDIRATYHGVELTHHLREPTQEEDLQYRRRISDMRVRDGHAHSTDTSLNAGLWLYDAICERVTAEDGDGEQDVPDFRERIPNDLKLAVINAHFGRFQIQTSTVSKRFGDLK
jgi:hypothetical protein